MTSADFGAGTWAASLVDRVTGAALPLDPSGWRGSAARDISVVSEAAVVLDPDYAAFLRRRPVKWQNELRFDRDGGLAWIGPITSIDDDHGSGVVWAAQDRMAWVTLRRIWWRSVMIAGESSALFAAVLRAADYGDPIGLIHDARPNGVTGSLAATAGDKTSESIDTLAPMLEWTVVGETIRFGDINVSAERTIDATAWTDTPRLSDDGLEPLSHVVAVTESNGRVFFPSEDPGDRAEGAPLLVDTIDVGAVGLGEASRIARKAWMGRQGQITIDQERELPLGAGFPLRFDELVPGAVMQASVSSTALWLDDVDVRLESAAFDFADGQEIAVSGALGDVPDFDPVGNIAANASTIGTGFDDSDPAAPFPADPGFSWGDFGFDSLPLDGIEVEGPGPGFDVSGPGDGDEGDPDYSVCPPSYCCALCADAAT